MKNRYFKVQYVKSMKLGGGQVFDMIVTFDKLTSTGNYLREKGFDILECKEIF